MKRTIQLTVGILLVAFVADTAQAGVFRDVVRGLEYSGFQFYGEENPLSGGATFALARNFQNETLDFGSTELTLTGPIQFTFETGGRTLPVLDVSINTQAQPFNYTLLTDVGGQSTTIEGSFLLNGGGSINAFGFYDFQFELSSRQDITDDGRFRDRDGEEVDFDIGPINVSGNIFADMLATLFDPIFASTGTPNIFASFSGRYQAEEELNRRLAEANDAILGDGDLLSEGFDFGGGDIFNTIFGRELFDPTFADLSASGARELGYVPDPPTMLLLAAGLPLLRRRHT